MSTHVLARLSARRRYSLNTFLMARRFERRLGVFDRAIWPVDYCDALTLVRREF